MADASPRVGKEWLLMELYIVTRFNFKKCLDAMDTAIGLSNVEELSDAQRAQLEKCRADMMDAMWHHILIPVSMGNGNADLGHKFVCIAHKFRITLASWESVSRLCRAIISVTSDYGVEHQIGNVAFDGRKLFNHWGGRMLVDNWDAECDLDTNTTVSFQRALKVPGTEHVFNNALNQCFERTLGYKPWHRKSKHVARFPRNPLYSDRLKFTCFKASDGRKRSAVHREFSEMLAKGVPVPYEKRFGMVVKFIRSVKPMKGIRMAHLRPDAFSGMGAGDGDASDDASFEDKGKVKGSLAIGCLLDQAWSLVVVFSLVPMPPR